MQLQLYALPASGLSQAGPPFEQSTVSTNTLTCLLQVSGLPQGQHIEVSVNDTLKRWQEGRNQSFSWEMQEYTDEILIHLRTDATITASWRGLWKGSAIFHVGTLLVRIFFNGVEQMRAEAPAVLQIVDPSRDPFPGNGYNKVRALRSGPDRTTISSSVETTEETLPRTTEIGDTEIQPEERRSQDENASNTYGQDEEEAYDDEEEIDRYEEETYDNDDEGIAENIFTIEQDPLILVEELPDESVTLEEGTASVCVDEPVHNEDAPLALSTDESVPVSLPQQVKLSTQNIGAQTDSTIGNVAVFHADPINREQTLERLKTLLSMMPRKTVIIDLREILHARQKEEYHPLSRTHLRGDFGGRYWDRSQYIKTIPHAIPDPQRPMGRRWERVVSDVNHPDGLPFLEKYLREGYSMILMDSIGRDEESACRAVVTALQERIPTLKDISYPSSN